MRRGGIARRDARPGSGFAARPATTYSCSWPRRADTTVREDVLGFSGVVLMLTDVRAVQRADMSLATNLFSLTARETQVLAAMGQYSTLEAVGQHLQISREAVRFHLKSIFLKTNTHRQAELVRLIAKLS